METKYLILGLILLSVIGAGGYFYLYAPTPSTTTTGGEIHFEQIGMNIKYAAVGVPYTCNTDPECVSKFGAGAQCSNNVCIVANVGGMWASHWVTNNYNVPVQIQLTEDVTCTSPGYPDITITVPNKNIPYTIQSGQTKSDSDLNTLHYDINSYAVSNLLVDVDTQFICSIPVGGTYVISGITYPVTPLIIQYSFTARKDITGSITAGGGFGVPLCTGLWANPGESCYAYCASIGGDCDGSCIVPGTGTPSTSCYSDSSTIGACTPSGEVQMCCVCSGD